MIEAETPTLWDIRRQLGHPAAVAILVNAFIHAAKLVNLDKNLTVEQIGEAANDTLESHGYLKVEEVKYLLKRALRTQNIYGRLDYNVLMSWVEQYDSERTEEAMRVSEQQESQALNTPSDNPDAVDFPMYVDSLRQRAKTEAQAAEILDSIENPTPQRTAPLSAEKRHEKDNAFRRFYLRYINDKQHKNK